MLKKYIKKIKIIFKNHREFFLLPGIILLGLGLRLINIGVEPYWSDEILSLEIARHYIGNLNGLWNYLSLAEVHPPLYYYLIQIWGSWFGFAEAGIRSLSLIFSLGSIGLTYYAGITLFNSKRIGLLAAFFTAILPIQIEYGQEARPYAIYCFFGILSLILLAKYFKEKITRKKIILIIGFILSSIIGLYLHYSYVLILIPLALYWLIKLILEKTGKEFIWWLSTMTIIFLGFFPWLPALIFKTFLINNISLNSSRGVYGNRSFTFLENTFSGLIWTSKTNSTVIEIITTIGIKMMLLGLIANIIAKNKECFKKHKKSLIYLGSLLLMSILLFLILPSSTNYTNIIYRHILFDSVILSLLLSFIFIQLKNIRWRVMFITLFVISLLTFQVGILGDDALYDINHRFGIVVNYINEHYQEGDLLLTNVSQVRPQLDYYLRPDLPKFISISPTNMIVTDFLATDETLGIIENESQLRYTSTSWPELNKKLNYLTLKNKPKRVWMFGQTIGLAARKWFVDHNWNFGFEPVGNLFPVTLYMKKND